MKLRLFNPFLLRRIIRPLDSIAQSLQELVRLYALNSNIPLGTIPGEDDGDDGSVSYSSDQRTWELIEESRRRVKRSDEEE